MSEVRFTYIKLKNFKKYRDSRFDFSGNPVVVFGPNESGKSTLMEAIQAALFDDAGSRRKEVGDYANLLTGELPYIELGMVVDGEELVIVRDYVNKKNILKYRGSTYQNKEDIKKLIGNLTGLEDRELFEISFSIAQEQISIESESFYSAINQAVKQLIERFKVSPEKLAEIFNKQAKSIKKGMERPTKEPGELKKTIEEIESLRQQLAEVEQELESSRAAASNVNELTSQISQLEQELTGVKNQKSLLESAKKLTEEFEEVINLSTLAEEIKRKEQLENHLKELEQKLASRKLHKAALIQWMIGELDKQIAQVERKKQALLRYKELNEKLRLRKELSEIEARIEQLPAELEQTASKCQRLIGQIEGRQTETKAQYSIELKHPDEAVFLNVDGKESKDALTGEFSEKLALETNQVKMEVSLIKGKTTNELKQELERILSQSGVRTVDELNEKLEERRRLVARQEILKKDLNDTPDEARLKAEIESLGVDASTMDEKSVENEISRLRKQKIKLEIELSEEEKQELEKPPSSLEEAENILEKLEGEIKQLTAERDKTDKELEKVKALIGQRRVEEIPDEARLQRKKNFYLTELPGLYEEIQEFLNIELDISEPGTTIKLLSEQIKQLEKRERKLEEEKSRAKNELSYNRGILSRTPDAGRKVEIEEKIRELVARKEKLEHRLKICELSGLVLDKALEAFSVRVSDKIIQETGQILASITGGVYTGIDLPDEDAELMNALLENTEHGIDIPARLLSRGASDQFYLAVRLALSSIITEGRTIPVIFDDTFSNFDLRRLHHAIDYLRSYQQNRQIFVFTCHEHIKSALEKAFTPQLIELS